MRFTLLPLSVNAPAPALNVMLWTVFVAEVVTLFTLLKRVVPPKTKSVVEKLASVGAVSPAQFKLVFQLLFAPPPSHVKTAAEAVVNVKQIPIRTIAGRIREQAECAMERVFIEAIFPKGSRFIEPLMTVEMNVGDGMGVVNKAV